MFNIAEPDAIHGNRLRALRLGGEPLTTLCCPANRTVPRSDIVIAAIADAIDAGTLTINTVRRLVGVSLAVMSRKIQCACAAMMILAQQQQQHHHHHHHHDPLLNQARAGVQLGTDQQGRQQQQQQHFFDRLLFETISQAVLPKPRGGPRARCTKMRPQDHANLVQLATNLETNTLTLRAIRERLMETMGLGLTISTGHLSHLLVHRHNITVKKPIVYAREGINERNLPRRREYIETHFRNANLNLVGVRDPYTTCAPRMAGQIRGSSVAGVHSRSAADENPCEQSDQKHWRAKDDPRLYMFTDESGFNMSSIQRNTARALRGRQAILNLKYERGLNHSLLIAIARSPDNQANQGQHGRQQWRQHGRQPRRRCSERLRSNLAHVTGSARSSRSLVPPFVFKQGSFSRVDFVAFVQGELKRFVKQYREQLPTTLRRRKIRFVMDNASIHHGADVEQALRNLNMEPVYLPPYGPTMNPCENVFHGIKSMLRSSHCTPLDKTIGLKKRVISSLIHSARHIDAYYNHCGYRM